MKILIVAATEFEISALIAGLRFGEYDCDQGTHSNDAFKEACIKHEFFTLVTGAGMVATAFALGKHLAANQYALAINAGIAGSFDRGIALGDVVEVVEDTFIELGAEDDEDFITIDNLGFGESSFAANYALPPQARLRKVTGATVNTVHGNEASIQKLRGRVNAQVESMEGAAFFYACKQAGVPCLQIRAVSNYVEKRNREAWQIGLAVKNLNTFVEELVNSEWLIG